MTKGMVRLQENKVRNMGLATEFAIPRVKATYLPANTKEGVTTLVPLY